MKSQPSKFYRSHVGVKLNSPDPNKPDKFSAGGVVASHGVVEVFEAFSVGRARGTESQSLIPAAAINRHDKRRAK